MAARTFIDMTSTDFKELASELARLSDAAKECAVIIASKNTDYRTDGMKNAVDGLESLAKVCAGILGVYNCEMPKLESIRGKLSAEKNAKSSKITPSEAVAKVAKVAGKAKRKT
jgi:hypothetical protein